MYEQDYHLFHKMQLSLVYHKTSYFFLHEITQLQPSQKLVIFGIIQLQSRDL